MRGGSRDEILCWQIMMLRRKESREMGRLHGVPRAFGNDGREVHLDAALEVEEIPYWWQAEEMREQEA